ncbi:hypothetical protein ACIQF6_03390 [Kitasatospora sp. NPDC092948]|uniref:hypothetical protein n=1 Tax=Kitasatospora sp. NPDC092948 TaxID=3364088 RepID=UPI003807F26C
MTTTDVTDAVTAVKGPRAHERAVALRSLFRALKHASSSSPTPPAACTSPAVNCCPPLRPPACSPGYWKSSTRPADRLVLSLAALHATNGIDLRNRTLSDVLLTRRQLLIRRAHGRHIVHLDDSTTTLLHAWLRYRHRRWPRTANPHLLITQQTASTTNPVSGDYIYRRFDLAGVTLRAVRVDRILDEAHETEDPVHLVRVFGISVTSAMKDIHTAHPHRGGPIPR